MFLDAYCTNIQGVFKSHLYFFLVSLSPGSVSIGALLSSEMFVILMLYLWLGIGLACAGFCCHQMLLILRGQTRYQVRKGMVVRARPWRKNLQEVFGKRWLLGLLIPVLNVGNDCHRQKDK